MKEAEEAEMLEAFLESCERQERGDFRQYTWEGAEVFSAELGAHL